MTLLENFLFQTECSKEKGTGTRWRWQPNAPQEDCKDRQPRDERWFIKKCVRACVCERMHVYLLIQGVVIVNLKKKKKITPSGGKNKNFDCSGIKWKYPEILGNHFNSWASYGVKIESELFYFYFYSYLKDTLTIPCVDQYTCMCLCACWAVNLWSVCLRWEIIKVCRFRRETDLTEKVRHYLKKTKTTNLCSLLSSGESAVVSVNILLLV